MLTPDLERALLHLSVQDRAHLAQVLLESLEPKPDYAAAKARALARLEHGYDLDWAPPASRDELHDR
jgi:hypothetical protein